MAIIVDITTASSIFWKERYENQTKPQKHFSRKASKRRALVTANILSSVNAG